jgi:restriction system protein
MTRKKQSPFEDIIDISSKLPWKISCALALVSYLILHVVAGIKLGTMTGPGQMGNFVVKQLFVTLAMFGQFVLPFAFLLGALLSFINAKKRDKLYTAVAGSSEVDALFAMSWQEFEMLMEEYFRRRGYTAVRNGGNGPDGGVDIVLKNKDETYLVQCKQWKAQRLGVQAVRELYGVMSANNAVGGFVVCAGKFTDEAKSFAENINIRLFDGAMLHRMIREAQTPLSHIAAEPVAEKTTMEPSCPKCGSSMVRRVARQGANAGREFFGCSSYPRCNGISVYPGVS